MQSQPTSTSLTAFFRICYNFLADIRLVRDRTSQLIELNVCADTCVVVAAASGGSAGAAETHCSDTE